MRLPRRDAKVSKRLAVVAVPGKGYVHVERIARGLFAGLVAVHRCNAHQHLRGALSGRVEVATGGR